MCWSRALFNRLIYSESDLALNKLTALLFICDDVPESNTV